MNRSLPLLMVAWLAAVGCGNAPPGMAWIPGGPFTMGTDEVDERGRAMEYGLTRPWFEDERPAHTVQVNGFFLDRNEVTNGQFAAFVAATGSRLPGNWPSAAYPDGHEHFPVTSVNWHQADDYCRWAGKRLPTEAEWEKAARGPDGRRYPWGNDFDLGKANLMSASIQPVGRFPQGQSAQGVNDLVGNAWEWTADWYLPYPGSTLQSPDFGQKFKSVRGRSWSRDLGHDAAGAVQEALAHEGRSGFRFHFDPIFGFNNLGFRCAR